MSNMKKSGPAASALLSAAVGCFVFSLTIVLAVVSPGVKSFLDWCPPAGPLSGKVGVGVIAWVVSWIVLHLIWRSREISLNPVTIVSLVLIVISFLGSFPPVYDLFGH